MATNGLERFLVRGLNPFSRREVPSLQGKEDFIQPEEESKDIVQLPIQNQDEELKKWFEQRRPYTERWRKLPRVILESKIPEFLPDGTIKPKERMLLIAGEQVMHAFEEPWCRETVEAMFEDKSGPLTVVERGFGLGIMADYTLQKMLSHGGKYYIIELNDQVYGDLEKWIKEKKKALEKLKLPSPLEIIPIHADADEAILSFAPGSLDIIISDTHQVVPEERGINDLLLLSELKKRLKQEDGSFTFCAFHKYNQKAGFDEKQIAILSEHFDSFHVVKGVDVNPTSTLGKIDYFQGSRLPVVRCKRPIYLDKK